MSYLIGWALLLGIGAIAVLLLRRAGPPGGSREPRATCGTGECGCGRSSVVKQHH